MNLSFLKYESSGNDFIIFEDKHGRFPIENTAFISFLCRRHHSVGGDGVLVLQPSLSVDGKLRMFNPDGKEIALCGNGLRCAIQFMHQYALPFQEVYRLETLHRTVMGTVKGSAIEVDLGRYLYLRKDLPIGDFFIQWIDTGVPHLVAFVNSIEEVVLEELAPFILERCLALEPIRLKEGANVSVAVMRGNKVLMRSYERGVEKETLACGTGAAAAAIAAHHLYGAASPIEIIPTSGEPLWVYFTDHTASVLGNARLTFMGFICYSCGYEYPYSTPLFGKESQLASRFSKGFAPV